VGGEVNLPGLHISGGDEVAIRAVRLTAAKLTLPDLSNIHIELNNARVGILSDTRASRTASSGLDGLTYEVLEPLLPARQRLAWLRRQGGDHRPQPFQQLATIYRRLGYDDQARTVLLAERRRRVSIFGGWQRLWRLPWNWLQDALVGYGYAPGRAMAWLAAGLAMGWLYWTANPPAPTSGGGAPFHPILYTLDLILPTSPFGQESLWQPAGTELAVAVALQGLGWALSLALLPALARSFSRQ
jgi:hypothetical protein